MTQAPARSAGFELPLGPRLPRIGSVEAVALEPCAAGLAGRSIKREAKLWALELAKAIATSDVPGGVVDILTGRRVDVAPTLPAHMDVHAIDRCGAYGASTELEELAADNVERVVRGGPDVQSPREIAAFLELKTVWHPIGQ